MQHWPIIVALLAAVACGTVRGADPPPQPATTTVPEGDNWTRSVNERGERGSLHAAQQPVRGDTGKWRDDDALQPVPAFSLKPEKTTLDDWADQLLENDHQLKADQEAALLLRTRQLDDNDRVWVERIERRGNELTFVVNEAVWLGRYSKNFTFYQVVGVNVGRLPPGEYKARCIIQRLEFREFEDPARRAESLPKDEHASGNEPLELNITFTVAPQPD